MPSVSPSPPPQFDRTRCARRERPASHCGARGDRGGPTVEGAEEQQATCKVAKDPLNPLIVEWPGTSKVDLDSASLRAESRPVLDDVAAMLAGEPAWKLTIEGHTDASGSAGHNQTLSEQRAAAVRAYLVSHGVDAARLTAVGFGATKPVADNASELGRAQNRRVELVRH